MLCTSLALSCSLPRSPDKKMASDGVFTCFATLMSSFKRGTPNVTFLAPTPAKWKVFNVICVAGSPTLCAARTPTESPACAQDFMKRCLISPRSQSKDCFVSPSFMRIFLEASAQRTWAFKMIFALSSTARPMVSPSTMPRVTSNSSMSWFVRSTSSQGVYLSMLLPRSSNFERIFARPMRRETLMGMCCLESPSMNTSWQMVFLSSDSFDHSASSFSCFTLSALKMSKTSGLSHAVGSKPYSSLR
mmetsp:Transcript_110788/g.309615  ORF Transcript_110788/g.309615 Transcript_110788/m.309615 type:complete len:246 (+) Transcript_110788:2051-2788(+)